MLSDYFPSLNLDQSQSHQMVRKLIIHAFCSIINENKELIDRPCDNIELKEEEKKNTSIYPFNFINIMKRSNKSFGTHWTMKEKLRLINFYTRKIKMKKKTFFFSVVMSSVLKTLWRQNYCVIIKEFSNFSRSWCTPNECL